MQLVDALHQLLDAAGQGAEADADRAVLARGLDDHGELELVGPREPPAEHGHEARGSDGVELQHLLRQRLVHGDRESARARARELQPQQLEVRRHVGLLGVVGPEAFHHVEEQIGLDAREPVGREKRLDRNRLDGRIGQMAIAIDERELSPHASGYTYDTLVALREELGADVPLVMLIGADQYEKLETWHRSAELLSLCRFAVFGRLRARAGEDEPRPGVMHMEMPPIPIAATEIRTRIARGEDVSALVPPPVAHYIREHRLYGHP